MSKKIIKSLCLQNFKPFISQKFGFKPLTLLSGLNGTGKSSVLQSILLLRQSYERGMLDQELALDGELISVNGVKDIFNNRGSLDFLGIEVTWDDDTRGVWYYKPKVQTNTLENISKPHHQPIERTNIFTSQFCYLSSCVPNYKPNFHALERLPEGSLLLLEHPEFLLDSRSQTQLGERIANAAHRGVQIILETHSDHIFNGIRVAVKNEKIKPEDVGFLHFQRDKQKTKVTSARIDSNGRIDNWKEGFFDEWDKSLEKLLEPIEI